MLVYIIFYIDYEDTFKEKNCKMLFENDRGILGLHGARGQDGRTDGAGGPEAQAHQISGQIQDSSGIPALPRF